MGEDAGQKIMAWGKGQTGGKAKDKTKEFFPRRDAEAAEKLKVKL